MLLSVASEAFSRLIWHYDVLLQFQSFFSYDTRCYSAFYLAVTGIGLFTGRRATKLGLTVTTAKFDARPMAHRYLSISFMNGFIFVSSVSAIPSMLVFVTLSRSRGEKKSGPMTFTIAKAKPQLVKG